MKNFDNFLKILASEKSQKEIEMLIVESAKEEAREGHNAGIYLYDLIDAVTDYKLRKYHEWAFGNESR